MNPCTKESPAPAARLLQSGEDVKTNDPDDDKFANCAFAANADFIVTEDSHFDVLATIDFPKLSVVNLETLREILNIA